MASLHPRIEDYGLIGNTITAALVSRDGSIDWLCLPTFDGGACFAALLGTPDNGYWQIMPDAESFEVERAYRPGTAILDTTFRTSQGALTVTDFMPPQDGAQRIDVMRLVSCESGAAGVNFRVVFRCDYGSIIPWVQKHDGGIIAVAGPDGLRLQSEVSLYGKDMTTRAEFRLEAGESRAFCLTWFASETKAPPKLDVRGELRRTENWWKEWTSSLRFGDADCVQAVERSLITLKAMTFSPTGAIVAAPTTSLPEQLGAGRNWDYRYCWIRDATLTLYAFLISGFTAEARDWRNWLLRAAAGEPSKLQIMYGLRGERRLTEIELPWLEGYEASKPVRIGNAAHAQLQLDVYGELMDAMHVGRKYRLELDEKAWAVQRAVTNFLEEAWNKPDSGIWEMRGSPRHFTHSKIMAWVAFDRAIKGVEKFGYQGPVDEWRALRDKIRADVLEKGVSPSRNCFVQSYGSEDLDASLLLTAQLGFVPPSDPRFIATVDAVEQELMEDGFVLRYRTDTKIDGLAPGEGAFIACSFWLVDAYCLMGRYDDAVKLFERLLTLRNDLGLLAEEYDPRAKRQLGNFPQAFSHIALINSAHNLRSHHPPAKDRADGEAGRDKRGNPENPLQ